MQRRKLGFIAIALSLVVVVGTVAAVITSNTVSYTTHKTHLSISVTPQTSTTSQWDNDTVSYSSAHFPLTVVLTVKVQNVTTGATTMTAVPEFINGASVSGSVSGTTATYTSTSLTISSGATTTAYATNLFSVNDGTDYTTSVTASAS